MKYQTFKKFREKDYNEIYSKEKETKSIIIEVDDVYLRIDEQQFGSPIKPHIEIGSKGCCYCMNVSELIKQLSK